MRRLEVKKLTKKSPEIKVLDSWTNLENSESISKYVLRRGKKTFQDLADMYFSTPKNSNKVLAFYRGDVLVGVIFSSVFQDRYDGKWVFAINEIAVNPKYQHRGIGTQMITQSLANEDYVLGRHGFRYSLATISKENIPSQTMFENLGYELEPQEECFEAFKVVEKGFGKDQNNEEYSM